MPGPSSRACHGCSYRAFVFAQRTAMAGWAGAQARPHSFPAADVMSRDGGIPSRESSGPGGAASSHDPGARSVPWCRSERGTGGDPCRAAVTNQGPHLGQLHDASRRSRADPCSWKGPSKSSWRTAPLLARTGLSSLCAPADGASSSLGATRATAAGRSGRPHRRPRSATRSEDSSSRRAPSNCRSVAQPPDDWSSSTSLWACQAAGKRER